MYNLHLSGMKPFELTYDTYMYFALYVSVWFRYIFIYCTVLKHFERYWPPRHSRQLIKLSLDIYFMFKYCTQFRFRRPITSYNYGRTVITFFRCFDIFVKGDNERIAQNVAFATSQRGRNSFLFHRRNMLQMRITEKGLPPNDGPIANSPHRIDLSTFFLPANFSCLHEVYFSYGPLCWARPFRRKWNDQNWCIRSGVFRGFRVESAWFFSLLISVEGFFFFR